MTVCSSPQCPPSCRPSQSTARAASPWATARAMVPTPIYIWCAASVRRAATFRCAHREATPRARATTSPSPTLLTGMAVRASFSTSTAPSPPFLGTTTYVWDMPSPSPRTCLPRCAISTPINIPTATARASILTPSSMRRMPTFGRSTLPLATPTTTLSSAPFPPRQMC